MANFAGICHWMRSRLYARLISWCGDMCGGDLRGARRYGLMRRRFASRRRDGHAQKLGGVSAARRLGRSRICRRVGLVLTLNVLTLNVHVLNSASIRRTAHAATARTAHAAHCSRSSSSRRVYICALHVHLLAAPCPPAPCSTAPPCAAPPARVCIAISAYMRLYAFIRSYFALAASLCIFNFVDSV